MLIPGACRDIGRSNRNKLLRCDFKTVYFVNVVVLFCGLMHSQSEMKTLDLVRSKCKVRRVLINKGSLICLSVLLGSK